MQEDINSQGQEQQNNSGKRFFSNEVLSGIIVLSLVVGLVGGFAGGVYGARSYFKNGAIPTSTGTSSNVPGSILNQGSAELDSEMEAVVKKASPAVVSIVVSKTVSQVQPQADIFGNPFFFDPFAQPQQQPSSGNQSQLQEVGEGSG